jgi:hypothetical protein
LFEAVIGRWSAVVGSFNQRTPLRRSLVTLEELEDTLPNGVHDAEIRKVSIDYSERKVTFDLCVWVGDMDDPPERREAYREAQLVLLGLLFLVIEPPDPKYPFADSTKLVIDGCDMREHLPSELLASLPSDAFVRSIWVNEWNAFMHVAARDADLAWQGSEIQYRLDS